MKKAHIHSLDTLRGLAALAVCVFHAAPLFGFKALAPHAYLAVDFFFALSGLVLFTRYREAIGTASSSQEAFNQRLSSISGHVTTSPQPPFMSLWQFFVVRMARLYPLYLAASFAGFGYVCLHLFVDNALASKARNVALALFQAIFLIPNMNSSAIQPNQAIFPFASQAWSVLWEIIASLAFFFWARRGLKYSLPVGLCGFAVLFVVTWPNQTIDGGWQGANILIGALRALASFSTGIAIAFILENHRQTLIEKITPRGLSFIAYSTVAFAALYIIAPIKANFILEATLLVILFPVIIIASALSEPMLLTHPAGRWLGGISYALYLGQGVVIEVTLSALKRINPAIASPLFGLLWLAGLLALSTVVWKFYEMPAQNWLKAKFLKHS